jgi:hypothetical protein
MREDGENDYVLKCGYNMLHLGDDNSPLKRVKSQEVNSQKVVITDTTGTGTNGLYLKAGNGQSTTHACKILKFDNLCGFGFNGTFKNTAGNFTGNRFFQLQIWNENDAGYLAL